MPTPTSAELLDLVDSIREPQYLSDLAARAAAQELSSLWETNLRDGVSIEQLLEEDLEETIKTLRQFGEAARSRLSAQEENRVDTDIFRDSQSQRI